MRSLLRSAGKIIPDELSYIRAWSLVSMPAIDVPDSRLQRPGRLEGDLSAGKEGHMTSLQLRGLVEEGGQCAGDGGGVTAVLREGLG